MDKIEKLIKNSIEALVDPVLALRQDGARSLFDIAEKHPERSVKAVPYLITALTDFNWYVRDWAHNALNEIGKNAIPLLVSALDNEKLCHGAAEVLGSLGDARALPILIKELKRHMPKKEERTATAIYHILRKNPVDDEVLKAAIPLAEAYENIDARKYASLALREIGAPAIPALVGKMNSQYSEVRQAVILTLQQIDDPLAFRVIVGFLRDDDEGVRRNTKEILERLIEECTTIESLDEMEKKIHEGYIDLMKKYKKTGEFVKFGLEIVRLKNAIIDKKNTIASASKKDIILDDIPKPPKKGEMFQGLRRSLNG